MRWVVLALAAAAVAANWWSRWRHDDRLEQVSKPLATVVIGALAVVSGADRTSVLLAVVALTLCLVGDVALLPIVDRFVVGLGAFLLGHVVFVVLFVHLGLDAPRRALVAGALALVLVATVGRVVVGGARAHDRALAVPVVAYLAIISTMAVVGWATGDLWITVGSTSFVASDAVLGWRQFVRSRPWMPVTVMVTYHVAIGGLALALW
jgi:uncharacterized membrane protein YhhN